MSSTDRAFCLPEIIHIVFSYLDPQSSAICRRVRNVWAIIGAQYFLPEMHVFDEQSFKYLQEASKHPIIAKHLRCITYSKLRLESPTFLSPLVQDERYNRRRLTSEQLFDVLRKEQDRISMERHDSLTFQQTIMRFPKLESINIFCGQPRDLRNVVDRTDDWHATDDWDEPLGVQQLEAICDGIIDGFPQIRNIRVSCLNTVFFLRNPPIRISQLWKSITHLDLHLIDDGSDYSGLKELLQHLGELCQLRLCFDWESDYVPLELVIESKITWKHLKNLTLQRFSARGQYLEEIIASMTEVESLGLGPFQLHNEEDAWESVWKMIRQRPRRYVSVHIFDTIESNHGIWDDKDGLFTQLGEWLIEDPKLKTPCPLTQENTAE
jgi:hypothetical protein